MKGQFCSCCGHYVSFLEVILYSAFKSGAGLASNVIGIHTVSNTIKMKCPMCGEKGRWISE